MMAGKDGCSGGRDGASAGRAFGRKGAASMDVHGDLVEQTHFVRGFVRLCADGWQQGWHERNGGNLSYLMTQPESAFVRSRVCETSRDWVALEASVPALAGACLLVTGAGCYMRNIPEDPAANIGIVEIGEGGGAYRVIWGLASGARPTSELPSHLMNHAVRERATGGASRVLYHAHPRSVVAMTFVVPLTARAFSRALWKAMTECAMVFPSGVGVVPWMVPGGEAIARETSRLMEVYDAVVWAHHGLFAAGESFDATFGLMHTIEKAADIYCRARCMNGGTDEFLNAISDEGLRQIGQAYGVSLNEEFLEA